MNPRSSSDGLEAFIVIFFTAINSATQSKSAITNTTMAVAKEHVAG